MLMDQRMFIISKIWIPKLSVTIRMVSFTSNSYHLASSALFSEFLLRFGFLWIFITHPLSTTVSFRSSIPVRLRVYCPLQCLRCGFLTSFFITFFYVNHFYSYCSSWWKIRNTFGSFLHIFFILFIYSLICPKIPWGQYYKKLH